MSGGRQQWNFLAPQESSHSFSGLSWFLFRGSLSPQETMPFYPLLLGLDGPTHAYTHPLGPSVYHHEKGAILQVLVTEASGGEGYENL